MPNQSFDIKAVEKELQGMFRQGFLSQYIGPGGSEEQIFKHAHELYYWAIIRSMEAYSNAINEEFKFRFNSRRDYTDETFLITSTVDRHRLLSYNKNVCLGEIISESAMQDVKKDSKLAAIIKYVGVAPTERSSSVEISVQGDIEPRPENFEIYILSADLNCKVRKWFNSAAAEYTKELTEKLRQIAATSRPK